MQTIISDKHKFICVLIYKNATRTLREYFYFSAKYKAKLQDIKSLKRYKDYFIFTFVRNPYKRVLSCYLNKIINPPPHFIKQQLKPFGLIPNMSFDDFINFLCFNEKGKDRNDPHWTSQHKFIKPGIDFIGKLEDFDKDFKIILNRIGLPYQSPKHLNYTTKEGAHYTKDLKYVDKPKKAKPPELDDYYTDKTYQLIYERYKKDFEMFGYEKIPLPKQWHI
ncbi:MAG TPA: sulfotransferase family protein [Halanaerobiales bacterium]|nr:sulfotransferase family protein [Halanaerobiales bacterium]